MTFLWFKLFKPLIGRPYQGRDLPRAIMGEVGQVIQAPQGGRRGRVRFTTPLLGAEEWPFHFFCQQTVAVGDRVAVNDISGNTLIVIKR